MDRGEVRERQGSELNDSMRGRTRRSINQCRCCRSGSRTPSSSPTTSSILMMTMMLGESVLDMRAVTVAVVGAAASGKSSILHVAQESNSTTTTSDPTGGCEEGLEALQRWARPYQPTRNARLVCWTRGDVRVRAWDTSGRARLQRVLPAYYRHAHAVVVCFCLAVHASERDTNDATTTASATVTAADDRDVNDTSVKTVDSDDSESELDGDGDGIDTTTSSNDHTPTTASTSTTTTSTVLSQVRCMSTSADSTYVLMHGRPRDSSKSRTSRTRAHSRCSRGTRRELSSSRFCSTRAK